MRPPTNLALLTAGILLLTACGQQDPTVDVASDGGERAEEIDGALDGAQDAGEGGDPDPDGPTSGAGDLEAATEVAISDLATSEGGDPEEVEVVTAEPVTWSDGALGCPEPDMMYTQALVPGYRIVLALAGDEVHYHGAEGEAPQRCDTPEPPADDAA